MAKQTHKTIHIPMKNSSSTLRPIKDDLGLKTSGVFWIPCECGKMYVGQTASPLKSEVKNTCAMVRQKSQL